MFGKDRWVVFGSGLLYLTMSAAIAIAYYLLFRLFAAMLR